MADGNVQRGLVTDFGAGENSTTDTVTSVSTANAFARITNLRGTSAGPTAGTATARNEDDMGATCLLTDSTTVTLTRDASGVDEDVSVAYEVIEFPSTGNDAVQVRMHQNITMSGVTQLDTAISGVSDINNCVPVLCGVQGNTTALRVDDSQVTLECLDATGDKIRLTNPSTFVDTIVSVAVLEFTGSNWTVQKVTEHTATAADTVETETISAVTWADSMIFSTLRTNNDEIGHAHHAVFPGATTTTVKFYAGSTNSTVRAYVVSNSNLSVTHDDSIDGLEGTLNADGSDPMTINNTVTSSTLADHFVISTAYSTQTGTVSSILTAYNYYLTSTTNLRFWVASSDATLSDMEWTYQLVDISGLVDSAATSDVNFSASNRGIMRGVGRGVG